MAPKNNFKNRSRENITVHEVQQILKISLKDGLDNEDHFMSSDIEKVVKFHEGLLKALAEKTSRINKKTIEQAAHNEFGGSKHRSVMFGQQLELAFSYIKSKGRNSTTGVKLSKSVRNAHMLRTKYCAQNQWPAPDEEMATLFL